MRSGDIDEPETALLAHREWGLAFLPAALFHRNVIELDPTDDALTALVGAVVPSHAEQSVSYALHRSLGEGGMAIAFFAERRGPEGTSPVVLKVMRPSFVLEAGETAEMIYAKEITALERVNTHVPPTSFVAHMLATGVIDMWRVGRPVGLPWLALEYVHGGAEGTTLSERVRNSVRRTGFAFDLTRAAHAIDCISRGVAAVHEVDVLHRDLTPANVLCCGFGEDEIFKIVDFGIARPAGLAATFGGIQIGTPGYAAPEQMVQEVGGMGPWTDVFGLATLLYFILTGDHLFPVSNPMDGVRAVHQSERPSIRSSSRLIPDLKDNTDACAAIDRALRRATAIRPLERPQTASDFLASVYPWLATDSKRLVPSSDRVHTLVSELHRVAPHAETQQGTWTWAIRQRPLKRAIRRVAWDGDARCLAATTSGLAFWSGTDWLAVPADDIPIRNEPRFVHRMGPRRWLIGGDGGTLAVFTDAGVTQALHAPDRNVSFSLGSGEIDDLAVAVGVHATGKCTLHAVANRRWMKPLAAQGVESIDSINRLSDTRWLVAGRATNGAGYIGTYSPLEWTLDRLDDARSPPFRACATQADRELGVVVGEHGAVLSLEDGAVAGTRIPSGPDFTAAALDVTGCHWAAATGELWMRSGSQTSWCRMWQSAEWADPFTSIYADVGLVVAVSEAWGVIEGRRTQDLPATAR